MPLTTRPTSTRRAAPLLLAAATAVGSLLAPPSPAEAAGLAGAPAVTIVSPREAVVGRSFDVTVDIVAGAAPVTAVDVVAWDTLRVHHEVRPACTARCTVVVPVDTTSWRPIDLGAFDPLFFIGPRLDAVALAADGSSGGDSTTLTRVEEQPSVLRMATTPQHRDSPRYRPPLSVVVDDVLRLALSGRDGTSLPPARVEARLVARGSEAPVRVVSAAPVPGAGGRWTVDELLVQTRDLPRGTYDVVVRASAESGVYGHGERMEVHVNRPPYATWDLGPTLLHVGDTVGVTADVRGHLPAAPGGLRARVTVQPADGAPGRSTVTELDLTAASGEAVLPDEGGRAFLEVPGLGTTEGRWTTSWQLLDAAGTPLGGPVSTTYRVTGAAQVRWAAPGSRVATFGIPLTVDLTAPEGRELQQATIRVEARDGSWISVPTYHRLARGRTARVSTEVLVPATGDYVVTGDYTMSGRTHPLPPYALRAVTGTSVVVAVPAVEHGRTVDAVARVSALENGPGNGTTPQAGAAVSFQVRWAGEVSWRTVGTAVTGRDGGARLPVRPGRTGTWRAVTTSGADAGTPQVLSREVTATVRAAARITSAPARLGPGRTATVVGAVSPGALGPRAELQALAPGSRSWSVLGTAPVARDGSVTLRATLGVRGTWQLRLVQPGTSSVATGASAAKAVVVG